MLTRCIMVKAGTEYHPEKQLLDDPDCLTQLHDHVSVAHYVSQRPKPEQNQANEKGIIRAEQQEWPREFVQTSLQNRDPDAVVKAKIIKFADETALEDAFSLDEQTVTQDFFLQELEEFFQTRRSVVLVDLDMLKKPEDERI